MFIAYAIEDYIARMLHSLDKTILSEQKKVVRIIQRSYSYQMYGLMLPFVQDTR